MLTRKPISQRRRIAATALVLILASAAGATAWAAQPERKIQSTIALPPVVEGEAPEVLLPLQPFDGKHNASPRTDIHFNDAPPAPDMDTRPTIKPDTPLPEYPAERREEGVVKMELCISATGTVESAKMVESSGHAKLDEATLQWISKTALNPATRNGKPIAVCHYRLDYQWMLHDDTPASPPS